MTILMQKSKKPDPLQPLLGVFDMSDDGIMIFTEALDVRCNMAALRMLRHDPDATDNGVASISPLSQPDGQVSSEMLLHHMQLALQGEPQHFHFTWKRADCSLFRSEISMKQLEFDGGDYVVSVVRDLTDQAGLHQGDKGFRAVPQDLLALVDSVHDPLLLLSPELKIMWSNTSATRELGIEGSDIFGRHCYEVCHHREVKCEKCPVDKCFITGDEEEMQLQRDGKRWEFRAIPVKDESGQVIKVIEIARDITHQHKLELQLRHSQKMDAVGHLAGGVAHDFNNVLTAIIGYASLLNMKLREDDPLRKYAEHILSSSEKAAGLTQSLLAFSRNQILTPRPVNINEIIRNVQKLLVKLLREDIELKTILSPEPLVVMAESLQLEQVLMNLMSNAREAMPDGGAVSITTEMVLMDERFTHSHGYGRPGPYARISVTDTGAGIDDKSLEKIFEPFFTTKGQEKGAGLGLATAYGIVKQHSGYINVYSEIAQGTTFKIYLPLMPESLAHAEKRAQPTGFPPGGRETILLAEDDDAIRRSNREILENFGYTVIEATDGNDAIMKFQKDGDRINILILDVIMPRKNGKEVYDTVMNMNPATKVIFTSGYTADIINRQGIEEENLHFIPKPVSPRSLLAKVREVLEPAQ